MTRPLVADVWPIAAAIAASCHRVPAEWLTAPTRGRGARPPAEAWEAKRHAIVAAIAVADCSYAELGRLLGMHRDTVCHHCGVVRSGDDREAASERIISAVALAFSVRPVPPRTSRRRARAARKASLILSDEGHSSDNHGNVIDFFAERVAA